MTFRVGERVRVSRRSHEGHHRTPAYVKGRTGTIEDVRGEYPDPETRAYGQDGLPARTLYFVALPSGANEYVCIDLFEHWLEPA